MKRIEQKIKIFWMLDRILLLVMVFILWKERTGILSWMAFGCIAALNIGIFWWILKPTIKAEHTLDKLTEGLPGSMDAKNMALDEKVESVFEWLQETTNREYRMQVLRKQAELNELQSQINPHFLYNTLESIRGEALIEGMTEIADMTEALGYFFRYSISRKKSMVTLEEEIKNIQNYFLIQKFRFGDHIDMTIEIEEEDTLKRFLMPKLTIQPIVENAIFHGLETQIEKGTVHIAIARTDQRLVLVISDDGKGMSEEELIRLNDKLSRGVDFIEKPEDGNRGGIALDNVNQRIKIRFGNEYGLHVYSTIGCGTDVVVTLPVMERNLEEREAKERME